MQCHPGSRKQCTVKGILWSLNNDTRLSQALSANSTMVRNSLSLKCSPAMSQLKTFTKYRPLFHEIAQTSKHYLFDLFSNVNLIAFTGTVESISIVSRVACTVVTAFCVATSGVGMAGVNVGITFVHI